MNKLYMMYKLWEEYNLHIGKYMKGRLFFQLSWTNEIEEHLL